MRFTVVTPVSGIPVEIFQKFQRPLLEALVPPWAKITIHRFDGSVKGDKIELNVKLLGLIDQAWENLVTENFESDRECFFVDEGTKMPFPVTFWKHKHRIIGLKSGSEIRDEIEFHCNSIFLEWIMFPVVWIQFVWRKPIYKKVFGGN